MELRNQPFRARRRVDQPHPGPQRDYLAPADLELMKRPPIDDGRLVGGMCAEQMDEFRIHRDNNSNVRRQGSAPPDSNEVKR